MLLGYSTRPPYWKVLLRFCSQALAMAVHQERELVNTWKFQTRWVRYIGLLVVCLPWYCIVGLVQASCRNFNRKGFMTSEQRWKAVRMYNSLHPLWQLSLRKKIQTQIQSWPRPDCPHSALSEKCWGALTVWNWYCLSLASSPGSTLHPSWARGHHLTTRMSTFLF